MVKKHQTNRTWIKIRLLIEFIDKGKTCYMIQ